MQNRMSKYMSIVKELDAEVKKYNKNYSAIATFRILSFIAGFCLTMVGLFDNVTIALIFGIALLVAFVIFVKLHSNIVEKSEIAKSKKAVAEKYVSRFNDGWRKFEVDGSEFLGKEDCVAFDIDLLGANSLYQMINACHTQFGKEKFVSKLKNLALDKRIEDRQAAIKELAGDDEFCIDYEAAGLRFENRKKKFNAENFIAYCDDKKAGLFPAWAKVVGVALPVIFIISAVLGITGIINYGIAVALFLVILAFSWMTRLVTAKVIEPMSNINYVIDDYLEMLKLIDSKDYESTMLKEIKSVVGNDDGVIKAFSKLKSICQAYNVSFNPLFHMLLSGTVLWDYQIARMISSWKLKYGEKISSSFYMIGDMEELISLSILEKVRKTTFADISDDANKVYFNCEDIYHPLINPSQVVSNSASMKNGITIITGSNMSGKTTFLRTMAVNLVLAYLGAPVCAKNMSASYMKIFTSMRVSDDVANGISTFYAEILRIKTMAEYRQENKPMICLVDEIFKGTNSADRIVGATEAITRLAGDKSMAIVSTHDFELCTIKDSKDNEATNYHFEEYYENDELRFDYKIKDGRCTTTNARAILRMAGFSV